MSLSCKDTKYQSLWGNSCFGISNDFSGSIFKINNTMLIALCCNLSYHYNSVRTDWKFKITISGNFKKKSCSTVILFLYLIIISCSCCYQPLPCLVQMSVCCRFCSYRSRSAYLSFRQFISHNHATFSAANCSTHTSSFLGIMYFVLSKVSENLYQKLLINFLG